MKKVIILFSILIITVATLCGCNDSDKKSKANDETSVYTSQESVCESENYSSTTKDDSDNAGDNTEIKTDAESANNSDNSTLNGNNNSSGKSENEHSSNNTSPSDDEVYEVEIDFSELE